MLKCVHLFLLGCTSIFGCKGVGRRSPDDCASLTRQGRKGEEVFQIQTHVYRENIPQLLSRTDLEKLDRAVSATFHEVVFVIRQKNMGELTRILHDVSDPLSPNYGQHLTREEVAALTSNPESRDAVISYLSLKGASVVSETLSGDYITANAPVAVWEEMFNTEFFTFHKTHLDQRVERVVRAEKYWVPIELDMHVESVFNTIEMPVVLFGKLPKVVQHTDAHPTDKLTASLIYPGVITPAQIRVFYNMSNSVTGSALSTQAIYASSQQYFSPQDLLLFQVLLGLPVQPIYKQIGNATSDFACYWDPEDCTEGNLDIQYIMATSPISPTTFWYTDLQFSDWLVTVASSKNPPLIFSISYGEDERFSSVSQLAAFNTQAIKLGAMGVTIFVASGDDGANSWFVNDYGAEFCGYAPSYPASNPYVTAIGATSVRLRYPVVSI